MQAGASSATGGAVAKVENPSKSSKRIADWIKSIGELQKVIPKPPLCQICQRSVMCFEMLFVTCHKDEAKSSHGAKTTMSMVIIDQPAGMCAKSIVHCGWLGCGLQRCCATSLVLAVHRAGKVALASKATLLVSYHCQLTHLFLVCVKLINRHARLIVHTMTHQGGSVDADHQSW